MEFLHFLGGLALLALIYFVFREARRYLKNRQRRKAAAVTGGGGSRTAKH